MLYNGGPLVAISKEKLYSKVVALLFQCLSVMPNSEPYLLPPEATLLENWGQANFGGDFPIRVVMF